MSITSFAMNYSSKKGHLYSCSKEIYDVSRKFNMNERKPPIAIIYIKDGDKTGLCALHPHQLAHDYTNENIKESRNFSQTYGIFTLANTQEGMKPIPYIKIPGVKPMELTPQERGRIFLTHLYLGETRFSKSNWTDMREALNEMHGGPYTYNEEVFKPSQEEGASKKELSEAEYFMQQIWATSIPKVAEKSLLVDKSILKEKFS